MFSFAIPSFKNLCLNITLQIPKFSMAIHYMQSKFSLSSVKQLLTIFLTAVELDFPFSSASIKCLDCQQSFQYKLWINKIFNLLS